MTKFPFSRSQILVIIILLASAILRFTPLVYGNFWFTFDTARDYLWVRDIVILHKLVLIGPWASLTGVFYGPFWFYLLAFMQLFFGGHPVGGAVLVGMSFIIMAIVSYLFLRRELQNQDSAYLAAFFLSFSSLFIQMSIVPFFANLIPLITLLIIFSLYMLTKNSRVFLPLTAFLLALCFHFEPVYGLAAIAGVLLCLWFIRKTVRFTPRIIVVSCFLFLIPFLPQLVFELRHNFLETRAVILYFQGKNKSLEGTLPLVPRIINRFELFITVWRKTFSDNPAVAGFLLGIVSIYLLGSRNQQKSIHDNMLKRLLLFFMAGLFFFLLVFREEAKEWYVTGLPVIYILLLTLAVSWLLRLFPEAKRALPFFLAAYVFANTYSWVSQVLDAKTRIIQDPSIYTNQQKIIDYIYSDADGTGFSVYTYTPGVYDYPYQYLFWWYGQRRFGYFPIDLSYLPDKPPEYVPNKLVYEAQARRREGDAIYLIIEREPQYIDRLQVWYSSFESSTLPISRMVFPFGVLVEKRFTRL